PVTVALTTTDKNMIAYAYFKHAMWKEALDQWNSSNPSQILRAVCLMKTGRRPEATAFLLQSIKANPQDPLIINVATTMCGPLTKDESVGLWKQVLTQHPADENEVLWNIGKRMGNDGAHYFQQLLAKYPHSTHAPESAWRLFWSQASKGYESRDKVRKDQFTKALTTSVNALKLHPGSDFAPHLSFWCGKMQEQLGMTNDAISSYIATAQQFPATYYSYRAEQRYLHLQSIARGSTAPTKPIPDRQWSTVPARRSPNPNWNWPEPPTLFTWQSLPSKMGSTAALLAWLGFYDDCLKNLPGLILPEMKSWLYLKQGNLVSALGTSGYKIVGTPRTSLRWQMAYPLAYTQEVERECKRWNLDPLLIHGLIRQESRYDRNARSRSNAMGLMQLLKGTAYGVAKNNGIPLKDANEIYNPNTNIALGCAYLAYVLRRGDGNMVYAVASYNGGPNAVARWRKKHQEMGISDLDAYVENIPFPETQNYVRQVFSHYWNYEKLYGS
ncbi:MAG: lytic transglycosylase domain-containing protein, partial [Cyanobacteria bacterium]|nr:lytic transglycosylase domain-containing protein [Cyanobacteriota bacterium]